MNLLTEAKNDINMVAAMESRSSSSGLVGLQPGSHACGFSSKQQSRNDHSSWLVEEWHSLPEHVGSLLCSIVLGGGEGDIWMKWHQLEGFSLTYAFICHLGMVEQILPPIGKPGLSSE